jgi:hypothetical protein
MANRSMEPSMFHTYVLAQSKTVVDIDRASFLMDPDLWQDTLDALRKVKPRPSTPAQWAWDDYCRRHIETYKEPFGPDVIPGWDQPSPPPPKKPANRRSKPAPGIRVLTGPFFEVYRPELRMDHDLWQETVDARRKVDPPPRSPEEWAWEYYGLLHDAKCAKKFREVRMTTPDDWRETVDALRKVDPPPSSPEQWVSSYIIRRGKDSDAKRFGAGVIPGPDQSSPPLPEEPRDRGSTPKCSVRGRVGDRKQRPSDVSHPPKVSARRGRSPKRRTRRA